MNARKALFNLLGGAAIVLGLVEFCFQAQPFGGLYSVAPLPSYNDLIPLFSLIVGLAIVLGTNFTKRRQTRIGLLVVTVTILLVSTLWMASTIAYDQTHNPFDTAIVSAAVNACHASSATCSILLTNTGAGSTDIIGCYFANGSMPGTLAPKASIQAGGSLTVTCQQNSNVGIVVGTQVNGSIQMGNGGVVPFTSAWS